MVEDVTRDKMAWREQTKPDSVRRESHWKDMKGAEGEVEIERR